ncbi:MAG: hypothetical protein WCI73_05240 [Phycisphaerae bacterium]
MAAYSEQPVNDESMVQEVEPKFDAREYLKRTLPRQPGDFLKIVAMHRPDSFRVNWYSNRASEGTIPGLNIARIRESKFLYCRLNAEGRPEITYPAKQ